MDIFFDLKPNDAAQLAAFDRLPDSANVRLPVVRALMGNAGAATIWRWSKDGTLPHPVRYGGCTLWPVGGLRVALKGGKPAA